MRRLARGLLASGVSKGTRVGLLMANGPDWVVCWLAAARIGAIVVPLNTFYMPRELGWVLHHADVRTLLTSARFLNNDYLERLEVFAPSLASQKADSVATRMRAVTSTEARTALFIAKSHRSSPPNGPSAQLRGPPVEVVRNLAWGARRLEPLWA